MCFHCAAGISRSATMLLAVLMRIKRMYNSLHSHLFYNMIYCNILRMSLLAAFTLVHSKRPVVWPNRSFMRQLIACARPSPTARQYLKWCFVLVLFYNVTVAMQIRGSSAGEGRFGGRWWQHQHR